MGALAALLVAGFAVAAWLLPVRIDFADETARQALWRIRVPSYGMAAAVGGGLALAGLVFQVLVHNPLASPYILGISAGGSLGAVLAIYLGLEVQLCGVISNLPVFALVGCLGAIWIVFSLARRGGRTARGTLLLAGVVVNASLTAIILFVIYRAEQQQTLRIVRWLMGGIAEPVSAVELTTAAAVVLALGAVLLCAGGRLNVLTLPDDEAAALGVDVERTRTGLFLAAALLTAAAVSFTGPIGFVGLIVPHILRLLLGTDHRLLVPASVLGGGLFLVLAEGAAHTIGYPERMPVGILTALAGGPFFLVLLRRRLVGAYFD
ncbi:MAG: iron ABC transporter permease [Planctomycetes bacterium]|nr:iron ABC transporter permease [Planctomycetota bacterium]